MNQTDHNIALVRRYLKAMEQGAGDDELASYFADDVLQVEFPNQLNPTGQSSDLAQLLVRARQGAALLESQRFDVIDALATGERVALEAEWCGTLAVDAGQLRAGQELRAHIAMFFTCRDGRIARQHNYDCFDPLD